MSRLARDGTADPVSRDEILGRERGPSADHVQDWQLGPYSAESADHTYIHMGGGSVSPGIVPRLTMHRNPHVS